MTSVAPVTIDDVLPDQASIPTSPRIAVVVPLNFPDFTEETRELVIRFTRTALSALAESGAALQVIDVSDPGCPDLDEDVSGVLLLGGGDVDPHLYGHDAPVANLYGVDRGCDERTLALIRRAVDTRRPVLGICRGSQMINVAYGGSLIPDLGPDNPHRGHGDQPMFLDDTVMIEPHTRLAGILGRQCLTVRNGHHQAVGEVAPDLTVAARGIDGVVEAVEHRDPHCWVLGVQWHPEDSDGSDYSRRALFGELLAEACTYENACRIG
jgi:putative glutamine amidotransferase